jgi:DNA-binding CsgD family transcriptional regulator
MAAAALERTSTITSDMRTTHRLLAGSRVPPARLTDRERDVLALLCRRYTDAEIAELLFISPRTASTHVSSILRKLGASNRREAGAIALRWRLA